MEQNTYLLREANRGEVYKMLSALYYPPCDDIDTLFSRLVEPLMALAPDLGRLVAPLHTQTADHDALLLDHSALFVGPFRLLAPPYGSIYLEGKREVMGASTGDARRRYELAGLDMAEEIRDAPDHIAIELEFMYYLVFRHYEALQSDPPAAQQWQTQQISFLDRHLGQWVGPFAEKVRENARTEHYRILASVTASFIQLDSQTLATDPLDRLHQTSQRSPVQ